MKVVITIPAYNESKLIANVISGIQSVMNKRQYNYSILVIDDGSTDKTAEIAKKAGAIVYSHPKNYGLAETFKTEMEHCLKLKAEIIVHIDADGQYRAEEIPRLIKSVEEGYDLVLGSRFAGQIRYMPLLNRWGNIAFSKAISSIIKLDILDCQTGFRAFTSEVAEKIRIISTFTYTQEQIIKAVRQKFRVTEVPIHFEVRNGKSRLMKHPLDFALKAGINLLRIYRDYEPLKFFGVFGAIFFLPGLFLGFWLIYIFAATGIIGRLPTVMLTVLLISIGLQIWLFGFLADMGR